MRKDYLSVALAIMLFSTLAPMVKLTVGGMGSMQLLCLSSVFGTLFMIGICLRNKLGSVVRSYRIKDWAIMSGGLGIGTAGDDGVIKADVTAAYKIVYRSYERGLIMITLAGNILRLQPPLNITEEQLNKGFDIIDRSIADFLAGDIPDEVMRFRQGW